MQAPPQIRILSDKRVPARLRPRRWIIGAAVVFAVLAAAGVIAWYAGLSNRFVPMNFGVVEPGRLYRSGQISRQVVRRTLVNNHIGLIIDLSSRWEDTADARAERAYAKELGVERLNLTLRGNGVGDPTVYPRVLAAIVQANRQGKPVLVHCQSGAQRTGGIIAVYRMLVENQPPESAYAEMRRYGHDPRHNPELIPFLQQHLKEWKQRLADEGIIGR